MTDTIDSLQERLLAAHDAGDLELLARLYTEAGEASDGRGDRNRAAFFLTHAWIFALEAGLASAASLHEKLRTWGRC